MLTCYNTPMPPKDISIPNGQKQDAGLNLKLGVALSQTLGRKEWEEEGGYGFTVQHRRHGGRVTAGG